MRALLKSIFLSLAFGLALSPGSAWAAEEKLDLSKASGQSAPEINSGGMILQMVLALGFTVLVIWVVYRGLKLWNNKSPKGVKDSAAVEVLSKTEVDRDMTVYVLKLGDTVSAVGKTSQGTTLLKEMSMEEAVADGLASSINPSSQSVASVWNEIRKRHQSRKTKSEPIDIESILQETQPSRVEDLLKEQPLTIDQLLDREDGAQ